MNEKSGEACAAMGKNGSRVAAGPEVTDHERHRVALIKAAEEGSAEAHFELGMMYLKGVHGLKNPGEAFQHMKDAAELGYPEACLYLGLFYSQGYFVSCNPVEGLKCLQRAKELGSVGAYVELGCRFFEGTGVPRDRAKALELFRQGAELDSPEAQLWLGYMHYHGLATPSDTKQAVILTLEAARSDIPEAWYQLYEMASACQPDWRGHVEWIPASDCDAFLRGETEWTGVQLEEAVLPDPKDDLEDFNPFVLLKGAAAREHPEALHDLGKLAEQIARLDQEPRVQEQIIEDAKELLLRASDLGSTEAKVALCRRWASVRERSSAAMQRIRTTSQNANVGDASSSIA